MCPGLSILEYSNSVYIEKIFGYRIPYLLHTTKTPRDEMDNKLFVASTTRFKMPPKEE